MQEYTMDIFKKFTFLFCIIIIIPKTFEFFYDNNIFL